MTGEGRYGSERWQLWNHSEISSSALAIAGVAVAVALTSVAENIYVL